MRLQRVMCRMLLLSLAAAALPAAAAVRMSVMAETTNQPNPDAKAPPGGTQHSEVVLADTYISSRSGDRTVVFDFAQRRHYVLDEITKTYDEYSLFDVVGFRESELRNRVLMHKALSAAKVDRTLESLLEDEHELALQDATSPSPLSTLADGGDEVFASGGVPLLRDSKDGTPVSAPDAARFVQFLRYNFAGHPAVLAALQKEGRIPARLSYAFHPAWGTSTVALTIGKVTQVDAPASPLAGYAPRPPAQNPATLDDLVDRAWASRSALAAGVTWPPAEALAAQMRDQHPLDAFLTMTEAQLSVGRMPALTDEQQSVFRTDPTIQALARAVSAKDPNAMRQAVGALEMLRLQAQSRRYLLSLFEANDRARLGEAARARSLYADVLQANPALAGAYKDIGDFYFRNFDTARAWRSWEIARTLAPLYPTVGAVAQYEHSLATRFPEYFEDAN